MIQWLQIADSLSSRHLVLHDWPDADCKKILDNQKLSMKKGYSKLLIHEVVLDPNNPQEDGTVSDITMMALASGMESMSLIPVSYFGLKNGCLQPLSRDREAVGRCPRGIRVQD